MSRNSTDEIVRSDGSRITLEEIFGRVTVVEQGIIRFQEVGHGTPQALSFFGGHIRELSRDFSRHVLIVDLTDATHPDPDYREAIVDWMKSHASIHQCFVQPDGNIRRVMLRLMLGRAGINVTVHATLDEAVACAREKLAEAAARG